MKDTVLIVVSILVFVISPTESQKLCKFSDSPKTNVPNFIQHFSSSKCMRVSAFGIFSSSKVVLDECSYWNKVNTDQQLYFTNSTLGKTMLSTTSGMGDKFCLTTKRDNLYNDNCQSSNFDQNWTFKPVKNQKDQFLIEHYSSKKCLVPKSRSTGAGIELRACNSYLTEQIWKLCS